MIKTSVSVVLALATASAAPTAATPFVVRADQDRYSESTVLFGVSPNQIKISAADTQGQLAVFEYVGNNRGGPPLHVHDNQDEIFFVREGQYIFEVGGVRHRLGPGDTIFLPRGVPHTFAQVSEKGRLVFMFTPAGEMEDFFRAAARIQGVPPPNQEVALFAGHGMRVLGPPLRLD
jgi:quercetin dioxygenase-like cupin family protein